MNTHKHREREREGESLRPFCHSILIKLAKQIFFPDGIVTNFVICQEIQKIDKVKKTVFTC